MKSLLISESQDTLDSYADFFKSMGYENLCYRWLLKAMDNLEELKPDLVFINASDYPRHWKTLVQYIKTSGVCNPVLLLAAEHLNDDEQAKARFLGTYSITSPIDNETTREQIRGFLGGQPSDEEAEIEPAAVPEPESSFDTFDETELEIEEWSEPPEIDIVIREENIELEPVSLEEVEAEPESVTEIASEDIPVEEAEVSLNQNELQSLTESVPAAEPESIFIDESESEPQAPSTEPESFTFIHPSTKTPIYGSLIEYNPPLLFFRPDDENLFRSLRFGQKSEGIIKRTEKSDHVFVQIQGLDEGVAEVCILK